MTLLQLVQHVLGPRPSQEGREILAALRREPGCTRVYLPYGVVTDWPALAPDALPEGIDLQDGQEGVAVLVYHGDIK